MMFNEMTVRELSVLPDAYRDGYLYGEAGKSPTWEGIGGWVSNSDFEIVPQDTVTHPA